jgi:hypothetical protein
MDVEERNAIALAKHGARHILQVTAGLLERARRNVSGNDRVRNPCQPAMPEMDIRAAHL